MAGATVRLSVQGVAVGEDNPVRVTLRDGRNRVVGRGEGRMFRDRAVVDVAVDRRAAEREPGGALCAADVELTELGLKVVSAPLLVLPYAALDRAAWGQAEARDGDAVSLSCRLTGSAAGVERLEGQTAEVEVLRGGEGGAGDGAAAALFEPVVALRVPVADGRVEATWRVGYDADGKARIATQAELDAAAARSGGAAGAYRRPAWRFRVRLAGLAAESPEMGYRDHVDLAWDAGTDRPAGGAAVEVRLADGTVREETLGADGRLRLADVPPGPVEAVFGPDPRVWEPFVAPVPHEPTPPEDDVAFDVEPVGPVQFAAVDLDDVLLAEAVGPDPDDGFVAWLWGTIKGDFEEDPEPSQIVATMGVGFIPVLGQLADLRDVIANVYLLSKDGGWRNGWRWVGLIVTVVGFVPGVGDVLKGCFRFAVRGLRHGMGRAAAELAGAFAKHGLGSPQQWLNKVDLDGVFDTVREGFEAASSKAVGVFEEMASKAEAVAEGSNAFRVRVWNAFGRDPGEPSRLTRNARATASALRQAIDELRRVEAAGAEVLEGIAAQLTEIVRQLVGGADARWAAAGVDGRTISGVELRPARPLVTRMDGGAAGAGGAASSGGRAVARRRFDQMSPAEQAALRAEHRAYQDGLPTVNGQRVSVPDPDTWPLWDPETRTLRFDPADRPDLAGLAPDGIRYNEFGEPDFRPFHEAFPGTKPPGTVRIGDFSSNRGSNMRQARDEVRRLTGDPTWPGGGRVAPRGWTWHEERDFTMRLVPTTINSVPHTGGVSVAKGLGL